MQRLLLEHGAHDEISDLKQLETLIDDHEFAAVENFLQRNPTLVRNAMAFWGEGILASPANRGSREMIELLMRYGARVPEVSKWGPQYYFKHTEIATLLLERGMNPNHKNWQHFSLLHYFAADGHLERVRLLLDHGAEVDPIDEEYQSTPLGCAARWGQQETAALLLERGADPNRAGATWATPLAWARKKGHSRIESDLRRAGAR